MDRQKPAAITSQPQGVPISTISGQTAFNAPPNTVGILYPPSPPGMEQLMRVTDLRIELVPRVQRGCCAYPTYELTMNDLQGNKVMSIRSMEPTDTGCCFNPGITRWTVSDVSDNCIGHVEIIINYMSIGVEILNSSEQPEMGLKGSLGSLFSTGIKVLTTYDRSEVGSFFYTPEATCCGAGYNFTILYNNAAAPRSRSMIIAATFVVILIIQSRRRRRQNAGGY
jgi:hypothetical protein